MVWPDGERLRRWLRRRAEEKAIREQERALREAYAPELAEAEREKAVRELGAVRTEAEAVKARLEAERLRAEMEALRAEARGLRRMARPRRFVGAQRVFAGLAQIGERGQRMLGAPAPAKPTQPIVSPLRLFQPVAPTRPRPTMEYRIKRVPYIKKEKIKYREKIVKVKAKRPRQPVYTQPRPFIGLGLTVPKLQKAKLLERPIIGFGALPKKAPMLGRIPAKAPIISLWPQAPKKKRRK